MLLVKKNNASHMHGEIQFALREGRMGNVPENLMHLIFILFSCGLLNSFVYVYYFHSQVIEIKEGRVLEQ